MAGTSRIGVGVDTTGQIRQMEDRTLGHTPKDYVSPVDSSALKFQVAMQIAGAASAVGVEMQQYKARAILEDNLTPEETQKRLAPVQTSLSLLSLATPKAGEVARQVQYTAESKARTENQSTDRMNEKLALHEIAEYAKKSTSPEEYKETAQKLVQKVRDINTTGVSSDFLSNANSYISMGSAVIDNSQRGLKYGNTAVTFAQTFNREFHNVNPNPTAEELEDHFENLSANLGDSNEKDGIMNNSIFKAITSSGTPSTVNEITNGVWGDYLTPEQKRNAIMLAQTRANTTYFRSSDPLDAVVKDRNAHGIGVPVDSNLIKDPKVREMNRLLNDNVNFTQKSPKELMTFAMDKSNPARLRDLAQNLSSHIVRDFNNDVANAVESFAIPNVEIVEMPLPVIDGDGNIHGEGEFLMALENRINTMGYIINDVYNGVEGIDNILTASEKKRLPELFKKMTPEQKWGLGDDVINKFYDYNNKLTREDVVPFSLSGGVSKLFGDQQLGQLQALSKSGDITDGLELYQQIKIAELGNPELLTKVRKTIHQDLVNHDIMSAPPDLKTVLLGRGLSGRWTTKTGDYKVPSLGSMGLEALDRSIWGNSALTVTGGGESLQMDLKKYSEESYTGVDLEKEMAEGTVRVVPVPGSLTKFMVERALSPAAAAAGNWERIRTKEGDDIILSAKNDLPPVMTLFDKAKFWATEQLESLKSGREISE